MKKKLVALLSCAFVLSMALCFAGCAQEEPKEPLDLYGTWKQVDAGDSYQEAVIEGDTITINWVSDGGETTSLYWAGTYTAPDTTDDSYSWTSENDTEKTSKALMASSDETKDFTYENGDLSYEVSAMGTTTTVHLEKQE